MKKIGLVVFLVLIVIFAACEGDEEENTSDGPAVTLYNSCDGTCLSAQETLDFYIDGELVETIEPGKNKKVSVKSGSHSFEAKYTGTDHTIHKTDGLDITGNDHYYWVGCDNGTNPENDTKGFGETGAAPLKIDYVQWYIDSLEQGFQCVTGNYEPTQNLAFYINYSDVTSSTVTSNDVNGLYIYSYIADSWWWFDPNTYPEQMNTVSKVFLDDFYWMYDDSIEENGSVVAIGDYFVKVIFNDGTVAKHDFTVQNPDVSTTANYVYSTSFTGTPGNDYIASINNAIIVTASKTSTQITASFTINDSRVNSGRLLFYNADKEFLCETTPFLTSSTTTASFLNSGTTLYNDGITNTITVTDSDLTCWLGTFSEIKYMSVVTSNSTEFTVTAGSDFGYLRTWSKCWEF